MMVCPWQYFFDAKPCVTYMCVCVTFSNKKVIGISTLSRKEHAVAQTRELACTREVVPQVIARGVCVCMRVLCIIVTWLCMFVRFEHYRGRS